MKVTTKTGDDQTTFLRKRRPKDNIRVEVLGLVDELLAQFILTNLEINDPNYGLDTIIGHLNTMLAYLAMEDYPFPQDYITYLEAFTKKHEAVYFDLNHFVQASSITSAKFNVLRTRVRTLERRFTTLAKEEPIDSTVLIYLNRLSDYMFVCLLVADTSKVG